MKGAERTFDQAKFKKSEAQEISINVQPLLNFKAQNKNSGNLNSSLKALLSKSTDNIVAVNNF